VNRPRIGRSRVLERHNVGPHVALLRTEIESTGLICYRYILEVCGRYAPVLWITAEAAAYLEGEEPPGVHFLCTFQGDTHANYGHDEDYGDLDVFRRAALDKAREVLGFPDDV